MDTGENLPNGRSEVIRYVKVKISRFSEAIKATKNFTLNSVTINQKNVNHHCAHRKKSLI
jgi:hypothetical protein